jgi:hypothetical protein
VQTQVPFHTIGAPHALQVFCVEAPACDSDVDFLPEIGGTLAVGVRSSGRFPGVIADSSGLSCR